MSAGAPGLVLFERLMWANGLLLPFYTTLASSGPDPVANWAADPLGASLPERAATADGFSLTFDTGTDILSFPQDGSGKSEIMLNRDGAAFTAKRLRTTIRFR